MKRLLLLLLLLFALPLLAGEPAIDDVAWMSGHWSATIDGLEMEEVWLAPRGGMMTGMHRDLKNGKVAFFEFLRIEKTPEGVFYFAQPKGEPPTPFRLVEASATRAVFSNPEHDFPQRITYTLREGKLCGRVEGPPGDSEKSEEWCWSRH